MNYLIIVVFILIPLLHTAQSSTDYIIDIDSTKIYGKIEQINLSLNHAQVTFKTPTGTTRRYRPAELVEWAQDNSVYVSKYYPINKKKSVLVFMKLLSAPDATIKVYEYANKVRLYTATDLFLERNGILTKVRLGRFRKQMTTYFADQEQIVQLVKDKEVKKRDLLALVEEYNDLIYEQQQQTNINIVRHPRYPKKKRALKQIWDFNDMLLSTDEAAKKYMAAIEKATKHIVDKKLSAIEIDFGIGLSFFEQKQYEAAIPYLKKARMAIQEDQIQTPKTPRISSMLAAIYLSQNKYNLAVNYNTNALLAWKDGLKHNSDLVYFYNTCLNQGKILQHLPASTNNISWYQITATEAQKDWKQQLKTQELEAITHATHANKSVDFNLALLYYKKAQHLIPQLPLSLQANKRIEIQLALGALYFEAGEYPIAQSYYETTLQIIQTTDQQQHPQVVEIKRILSEIYLANELYSEALHYINQAQYSHVGSEIKIDRSLLDNINKIPFPFELLNSITTKGIILYEKNRSNPSEVELKKVLAHYAIATELLYKLRKTHRNDGSNFKLGNITHKLSQHAVIICNTLFNKTKKKEYLAQAFTYAELSKSAVLFETVHNLNSMEVAGIPRNAMVLENGLKVQISYLKGELFYELQQEEKAKPKRIEALQNKIAEVSKEHELLLKKFERNYPKYFALKYSNKSIQLEDLQKELSPDEVFLEYVVTDSFIYVLAIGPNKVKSQLTKLSHSLPYTIKKLQHALRNNKADLYAIHGNTLYQNAIGNLAAFIKGKKLIIAADAELNYIPFGVLPTNQPKLKSKGALIYSQTHFLIEDHPICYNYSAGMFLLNKQQKQTSPPRTIATWAPNFDTMEAIIKKKGIGDTLPPLPGAQQEAQQIANMFGSIAYLGADASELKFKEQAQYYSVLHIATHGVLNDLDPLFSSLILKNQGKEDGILHAFELYNMRLNANLAVLSACNSGMGQLTKGEGVVSIARGFSYAGVPNIIMSKWSVSDWSTELLMKQFYKNLKAGMPKDKALQQAKVAFLDEHREKANLLAPFYWGGFVLSGNPAPIEMLKEQDTYFFWYLGLFLLLIGIISIVWKKRPIP
ncbi:CHAT domain-containing protein [Aureispira anguillae]|uniref:CHAT domain-containing protein n=1 Tax=Aureispira anguillae TaxID=2864201 RepID=A0A915YL60_9BACT|nr:CHAT domain-containing tetratricopeptide repeat protein [Aureispira anguillae]BDS15128.1 CHAT domain-containing protein [Aureispira anguillae]